MTEILLSYISRFVIDIIKQIGHWYDPVVECKDMVTLQASLIGTAERVGRNWLPAKVPPCTEVCLQEEHRPHRKSISPHRPTLLSSKRCARRSPCNPP